MNHVISIGGGLSSTMKLPRVVIERHGRENVSLVMAKLPNEDPDVWRLCEAVERDLGVPIVYIGLDKTPWDIFFEEGFIGNTRIDPCSRRLKREVLMKHLADTYDKSDTTLHVGITAHEIDRMAAIRRNYTAKGWTVDAPLSLDDTITRESLIDECDRRYGFVPRLYRYGFNHNNCGGACVKAGQREWARLLRHLPDVYAWWEENEERFRAETGKDVSILRDRRGGTTKPYPLKTFRENMQAQWSCMLPGIDPFEGLEDSPACAFCSAA